MTKTNLLEKRKKFLEQRMNKLKAMEASLNVQERKRRTQRLIELGGLVLKAHLQDWDSNTLLGGLLFLKENEANQNQLNAWSHKGGTFFASEKDKRLPAKRRGTPMIVKFEAKPNDELKTSLRILGLKWNALRQEWEGYTQIEKLKELLGSYEASIIEINNPCQK